MLSKLLSKIEEHQTRQLPFVLYRLPGSNKVSAVLQQSGNLNLVSNYREKGFVFAPFSIGKSAILLSADEIVEAESPKKEVPKIYSNQKGSLDQSAKEAYCEKVGAAIRAIQSNSLEKVVLSRCFQVQQVPESKALFKAILQSYRDAFCYWWHHPSVGSWMGASPETLLKQEGNAIQTMSLAGTIPRDNRQQPIWKDKELQEQAIVTDFIVEALRNQVTDLQCSEPFTVPAGNVWHLQSTISGVSQSSSVKKIVESLHPTPAVCGFPRDRALQFISENEGYDRAFYTGFLGPLNIDSPTSTQLFVNLRCLQLKARSAKVYVGGGITKDSDPEAEWEETITKSQLMLRVLTINNKQ